MNKFVVMVDGFNAWLTSCATVWLEDGIWYLQYFKAYLEHPDAFALDPINLPLAFTQYVVGNEESGVTGVLREHFCGEWGNKVLSALGVPEQDHAAETIGTGAGVLSVVFATRSVTGLRQVHRISDLPDIIDSVGCVQDGVALTHRQGLLLKSGAGFTGSKPKAVVVENGRAYIAKVYLDYKLSGDFDAEYRHLATLNEMVRTVNCEPYIRGNHAVLLVERFDAVGADPAAHVINVSSMFPELTGGDLYDIAAQTASQLRCSITEIHELFKRRVFDLVIGNTEGGKHISFVHPLKSKRWSVAPAYGVQPRQSPRYSLTEDEIKDLLARSHLYGMDAEYANRQIGHVLHVIRNFIRGV